MAKHSINTNNCRNTEAKHSMYMIYCLLPLHQEDTVFCLGTIPTYCVLPWDSEKMAWRVLWLLTCWNQGTFPMMVTDLTLAIMLYYCSCENVCKCEVNALTVICLCMTWPILVGIQWQNTVSTWHDAVNGVWCVRSLFLACWGTSVREIAQRHSEWSVIKLGSSMWPVTSLKTRL